MSNTTPGQGGVGGAVAYYMYLNGVFEGIVNPNDASQFEGNWTRSQGVSNLAGNTSHSARSTAQSTASTPGAGIKPTDGAGSGSMSAQVAPASQASSHATQGPQAPAPGTFGGSPTNASSGSTTGATPEASGHGAGSAVDMKI